MSNRISSSRRSFLGTGATGLAALGIGSFSLARHAMSAEPSPADSKAEQPAKLATAEELIRRPGTLVIAHRGLPSAAPENTLPSFAAALEHKPDFVELDYRETSDGELIVIHDATLDRTTNSRKVLGDENLPVDLADSADLAKLDAGSWYSPKFAGTKLPTLAQAIDLVCPKACLMIERKGGGASQLLTLLYEKNVLDRVIVQSFDWEFIQQAKMIEPKLMVGFLGKGRLDGEKSASVTSYAPQVIGWDYRDLDADLIRHIHGLGKKVWSYTINDPEKARELAAAGLDGLITNHADKAREWLAAK